MNILIDAYGGDNAPQEVINGAVRAVEELGVEVTLVGDVEKIRDTANTLNVDISKLGLLNAETVFDIHEEPTEILKSGKNSSMAVGLGALNGENGDAFVSAGSTGALLVGATFIVKRIKGIKRAALAPLLPSAKGNFMLLDAGANTDCRADMIQQFAIMGSAYMENVMGIEKPAVGLANIGSEETKGRELEIESYKLLEKTPVNFKGNAEAREIPLGNFDVIVTDGFTGNILLKLYEGMGSFFGKTLKGMFTKSIKTKIAALLLMKDVKIFKKKLDYSEVGGAVFLGIRKPVIKAHGSSDSTAFFNAVRQAKKCVEGGYIEAIQREIND